MGRHLRLVAVLGLGLILSGAPALAQADLQVVQKGKQATALVLLPNGAGSATGFCIDPAGIFVTNAHVLEELPVDGRLTLVLNAGEANEVTLTAQPVRVDQASDLALLSAPSPRALAFLPLGYAGSLVETATVTAFGYPFGELLAAEHTKYPGISVNVARITSMRRDQGRLEALQIDSQLNPGNSGGPLLDAKGNVVGIVSSGIPGAGINFAVPVDALREMLSRPTVSFDALPEVPFDQRYEPVELAVRVVPFGAAAAPFTVEFRVAGQKPADTRRFAALPAGGNRYSARVAPLVRPAGPAELPATVDSADGSMRCRLTDQTIQLDGQNYTLSQIRRIERRTDQAIVVLRDGRQVTGKAFGNGALKAHFGGRAIEIDLAAVTAIGFTDPESEPTEVECTVVVWQGDKALVLKKTHLRIRPQPATPVIVPTAPTAPATPVAPTPPPGPARSFVPVPPGPTPPVAPVTPVPTAPVTDPDAGPAAIPPTTIQDRTEIRLPSRFAAMRIGAGGRYLVFHFKEQHKLVVLDVAQGALVRELPMASDDLLIAAGADKLMVVLTAQGLLQRWSLTTFERERTIPLQGADNISIALLGPRSRGPLLLWSGGPMQPFELETMARVKLEGAMGGDPQYGYRLRASFNGQVFTGWHCLVSPEPTWMMRIEGGRATQQQLPGELSLFPRWQLPNGNGSYLFDHGGAMRDAVTLKDVAGDALHGSMLMPCLDDRYFLSLKSGQLTLCTTCDRRPVYVIGKLEEMKDTDADAYVSDNEPRFYYYPTANLLLTIPRGNDRVVLRRFDLMDALAKWKVDYLFVDSLPPTSLKPGAALSYQLAVHSKAGGVKLRLEDGPEGMRLSETGLLTWTAGTRQAAASTPVIISVTDASGQVLYHNFDLRVR